MDVPSTVAACGTKSTHDKYLLGEMMEGVGERAQFRRVFGRGARVGEDERAWCGGEAAFALDPPDLTCWREVYVDAAHPRKVICTEQAGGRDLVTIQRESTKGLRVIGIIKEKIWREKRWKEKILRMTHSCLSSRCLLLPAAPPLTPP